MFLMKPSSTLRALVEMGGVEPPSESVLTGTSPGAAGCFGELGLPCSLPGGQHANRSGPVASSCVVRAKLTARTFPTHRRSASGPWASRRERSLIKQREEQCYRCSLIYKLPVLWRSGAAARYSGLHTPVETETSPQQAKVPFAF